MMRAKLIYEKFSEDSDPIKDMGIGFVQVEDIIQTKDQVDLLHSNEYNYCMIDETGQHESWMPKGHTAIVLNLNIKEKYFIMKIKAMDSLEQAITYLHDKINRGSNYDPFYIKLTYEQFTQYYKIVNK